MSSILLDNATKVRIIAEKLSSYHYNSNDLVEELMEETGLTRSEVLNIITEITH